VKIAVLGASGFIGSRVVEALHLSQRAEVRPVVRRYAGLARAARFDLDFRVAPATDFAALSTAFAGCDVVIHAIAGDPSVILGTLEAPYRAAQAAGVRRIVYLSSASVHGQSPAPGTDESTPLNDRQPLAYNNAKVQAERKLLQLRRTGKAAAGPNCRWQRRSGCWAIPHVSPLPRPVCGLWPGLPLPDIRCAVA
jgi:nucleoside-diphosphate-sugar epimerase